MTEIMIKIAEMLAFFGGVLITVYGTHQAIIMLAGRARDWMEIAAGIGGMIFLVGVYIAGARAFAGEYVIAYSMQAFGAGLLLLPRVVRITMNALRG